LAPTSAVFFFSGKDEYQVAFVFTSAESKGADGRQQGFDVARVISYSRCVDPAIANYSF